MTRHRIPPELVQLGTTLELVTEDGDMRTLWDEVAGWRLLAPTDAFDRRAPYGRLYLVPGEFEAEADPECPDALRGLMRGTGAYRRWHSREHDYVGVLDVPDNVGTAIGRAVRLDYASDKWHTRGRTVEYTHDFTEYGGAPLAYVRNRRDPKAFVLAGGDMEITERGIA